MTSFILNRSGLAKWLFASAMLAALGGVGRPLPAQSVAPDGPKPAIAESADDLPIKSGEGRSVILELDDAGSTYKRQLDASRKAFHDVVIPSDKLARLQTAEKKFRDSPNDSPIAGELADAFAEALEAFDDRLRKFLETREELVKNHSSFVASTKAAIQAVKKERDRQVQDESKNARVAQQFEHELDQLTVEYREVIERGEPLPPEIDKQVVRLSNLMQQRLIARQLHADRATRAARNQSKLEASLAGGERAMAQMELRFEKADGDQALIAEIAQAKADELSPDPVSFSEDDAEFVQWDPKVFLNFSAGADTPAAEETSAPKPQSLGGAEVLKARLKRQAETSAKTTVTSGKPEESSK